jgi:hypothetical protein
MMMRRYEPFPVCEEVDAEEEVGPSPPVSVSTVSDAVRPCCGNQLWLIKTINWKNYLKTKKFKKLHILLYV